ncbi:uncharacterized protein SCHCODRAFT_02744712 [Schizophyllum commune H4-8]|uniref:Uncharacterized protein n=1 Tax=Schizophyllum commune (strain H4-8 / FGSC 9210) TaxID=578458 RepID=D8PP43_SCHCM|nr:uncharacterized protein SCHCODRAFT_02744712 [Schizophyllum commune H4-8]KAI5898484.1 hypothetical protein SCHCODRAFT_02744712 [Schizophyllum commune H4-8]
MAFSSPTKSQPYSLGPDNTPVGREIDMWRRLISPEKPKKKNNAAPRKRIGEYAEHKAWFEQRFGQRIVSNVDTNSNELGRVEPTSNKEEDTEGLGNDIEGDCDQSSDLEDTALPGSDDTVTDVHRRAPSLSGTLEDVDNDPTSDVVNSSDDDDSGYDTPKYAAPSVHSRCNVDSGYDNGKSDASEDSDDEEESDSSGNSDEEKEFDSSEDSDSNDEESD